MARDDEHGDWVTLGNYRKMEVENEQLKAWKNAALGCLQGFDVLCNDCQRLSLQAELSPATRLAGSDDYDGPYCPGCGSDDLTDVPQGLFEAIEIHIQSVVEEGEVV